MKCPNCGNTVPNGFLCPSCGVDTYIFKKARNASIRLYNDGLEAALAQDLSAAATLLEQSILFDKNNYQARNLLGLVYAETGRMADALKHWIVSNSLVSENNPAAGYIEYLQKHARKMDQYNDAVRLYNQALHYLHQGSDDLAIIQLKKSLDLSPGFIDANNLMTLCCLMEHNEKRAQHFIDAVLRKDVNNPIALRYSQELGKERRGSVGKQKKRAAGAEVAQGISVKKTDSAPPMPRYKRSEKKKIGALEHRDLIAFGVGIVATALVLLVLVLPAINENKDKTIETLQAQVESYQGETNMTPEEVLAMREKVTTLEAENKQLRSEETKQANLELLETAVSQLNDKQFEECVTTLDSIETVGFSDEDLQKYESVKTEAYPQAANSLYTKGKSEFLSNNFTDAKPYLEKCLNYTTSENFIDDAYYYLAKIAEEEKDTAKAKEYYEKIKSTYPDSNQIENVNLALENLNSAS